MLKQSHACATQDAPTVAVFSDIQFQIAESLDQITAAWGTVYQAYRDIGLIAPNPYDIHTHPYILSCDTAVVFGQVNNIPMCTLSSYIDGPDGLPLDSVYPEELDSLRSEGKTLLEVGLFADQMPHSTRAVTNLLELMRFNCYFGVSGGCTDAVIGVHPHHVKFYTRLLDFKMIGHQKTYATVNHKPVVLLQLDWYEKTQQTQLPRGLKYFIDHPLTAGEFLGRFPLNERTTADSAIEDYLESRTQCHKLAG